MDSIEEANSSTKLDLLEPISEETANRILSNESLRADCLKRGVDLELIVSNLKLTFEERIERLQGLLKIRIERKDRDHEGELNELLILQRIQTEAMTY